jgi:hypothetical protein
MGKSKPHEGIAIGIQDVVSSSLSSSMSNDIIVEFVDTHGVPVISTHK